MRRVEYSTQCNSDEKTTWKHFIAELWLKGAGISPGLTVEDVGDETGNGATRWIPVFGKYGIREGIFFTRYPEYIQYRVMDLASSAFPVKHHQGRVDFIPGAQGTTRVVWSIEYLPKTGASLLVKMMISYVIPRYLAALKQKCDIPTR